MTNVLGALIIGVIAGMAARKNLSLNLVLFLKTGVCGGFTTFSTFSLEAYTLIGKGHYGNGFYIYVRQRHPLPLPCYGRHVCIRAYLMHLSGRRLLAQSDKNFNNIGIVPGAAGHDTSIPGVPGCGVRGRLTCVLYMQQRL